MRRRRKEMQSREGQGSIRTRLFGHNRKRQKEQTRTNRNVKLLVWTGENERNDTSYYLLMIC